MQLENESPKLIRIAYDITRMSAGSLNGGIKIHHWETLKHFVTRFQNQVALLVFCSKELVGELSFLNRSPFSQIHVLGSRGAREYNKLDSKLPTLHFWPEIPDSLLSKLKVDLLYCGFGVSKLSCPEVPQISLLVDALHKDMPGALPSAEVTYRHNCFLEATRKANFIQTNSKFCVESIAKHYGAPKEKLFHMYLPFNGRFNEVEMAPQFDFLQGKQYFFYPSNHWPHKNHESLLVAYKQYYEKRGEDSWRLVLTGADSERKRFLMETRDTLGLSRRIHFLDYLDLSQLKTVWEHCNALVYPSLYEGFGLPLLEAMHFQKPIIAGEFASIPEVVGDSLMVCDPRKPADIARALEDVTASNLRSVNYAERLALFDLDREMDRLFSKIQSLANQPIASS